MCDVRLSFSAAWLKITNRCVSCSGRNYRCLSFGVNQPNASRKSRHEHAEPGWLLGAVMPSRSLRLRLLGQFLPLR